METIETKRLRLRKAVPEDLEAVWKNVWQDREIARWMFWKPTYTYEEAAERMRRTVMFQQKNDAWFVCLKETDEVIGFAGIRRVAPAVFEECGICVASAHQNRGYGQEIIRALLEYVFLERKAEKFVYACMQKNERSKAIALKYGFRYLESLEEIREWDSRCVIVDYYRLSRKEYTQSLLRMTGNENEK